jgi:DNA-binding GntR family transcriptional regulator
MYHQFPDGIPRYLQIADTLRRRLATFSVQSNGRLPSEKQLGREFRVSRETIRAALALLREEGLVYSVVGRGTLVSPGHKPVGVRITLPISDPYVAGRPSAMRVLAQGYVPGPTEAIRALGLPQHSKLYLYRILRTIKGCPFRFARVYLPEDVAERIDRVRPPRLTVSEKLEREAGLRIIRAHQVVMAVSPPVDVAKVLGLSPGATVLMFRRTYYNETGEAIEFAEDYQDTHRFPYEEVFVRSTR